MKDEPALRRFATLIRARSGIELREQEAPLLDRTLAARVQAHRFSAPERYLDFLCGGSPEAGREWNQLFVLLTNQESYFFRDPGQLAVIRDHVLPELFERNRGARTLRIWSAGCSTGEEAYSLAMMLDEALPLRDKWRVLILGTDLSESAVQRAQSGVYGAWSFRAFDSQKRERFFTARGDKWQVKPLLRDMVTFAPGNLLLDDFPSRATLVHDMDLIVCRNVFIYFEREAVARVLRKFSATLSPGGFLVSGHTELHDVPPAALQARQFPQSVIYQRPPSPARETNPLPARLPLPPLAPLARVAPVLSATQKPAPLPLLTSAANGGHARPPVPTRSTIPAPLPVPVPDSSQVTGAAKSLIETGRSGAALTGLLALLKREPRHLEALCLAAQAQANAGHLEEAETLCRRCLEASPFAPLPYHVLARISDERGDFQNAKALLKKVIYLNPASVRAYLELGAIYSREGDAPRAAQMQRAAKRVLEPLAPTSPLPGDEFAVEAPLTVGELLDQLQTNGV